MGATTTYGPRDRTLRALKATASQWWIASETPNDTVVVLHFVNHPEHFRRVGVDSMGEITMSRRFYPADDK